MPRRPVARLLIIGVCTAAALAVALAASVATRSHAPPQAGLASSYPPDGAALPQAPEEVDLAFTSPVDLSLSHLSVLDASGAAMTAGEPRLVTSDRLQQPVLTTAAGEVTVAYHATFVNGAELAGVIRFNVGNGAAARESTPERPAEDATAGTVHRHGIDPVSGILLVLDGIVALGVIVLLRIRPRPRLPR